MKEPRTNCTRIRKRHSSGWKTSRKRYYGIMEIIRDTPEYKKLMHSLSPYAEEDRQAAWWQGARNRTPCWQNCCMYLNLPHRKRFILGPVSGRTHHAFGYADPEYVKNLIYRIEIELDWGYVYGKKNEYRKKKRNYMRK